MSGGSFDYKDQELLNEIFDYEEKCSNKFEDMEISELVWDVLNLIHEYDWYHAGDTGEDKWLKAKIDFKNKWFNSNREERIQRYIDNALSNAKEELEKTFLTKYIDKSPK